MSDNAAATQPACAYTYTVKRGDSFYLIARRLGVPLRDLGRTDEGALVCTLPARDFRRLHRLNRRCRCRIRIRSKGGLPRFLGCLWRRRIPVLGMAATVLLWSGSSWLMTR